jgi:hypothetical protein
LIGKGRAAGFPLTGKLVGTGEALPKGKWQLKLKYQFFEGTVRYDTFGQRPRLRIYIEH